PLGVSNAAKRLKPSRINAMHPVYKIRPDSSGLDPAIHAAFDFKPLGWIMPHLIMDHRIKSGGDAEWVDRPELEPLAAWS
ncbi:hypothetical protein, partial [Rhodobium orientis]